MDKILKPKNKEPAEVIKVPQECIKSELVLPQFKSMCEEIICSICLDIVWNPVSCGKCTSPFSKTCLGKWFQLKENKCPKGCAFEKAEFPLILKRMMNKIEFNCQYKSKGCKETVLYEDFFTHVNSCPFAPYKCIYPGCNVTGDRKSILEHSKSCNFFLGHCQKCRFLLKRADYYAHKENKNNICFDKCLTTIEKLISQNDTLKKENAEINKKLLELKKVNNEVMKEIKYKGASLKENNEKFKAIEKILKDKNCSHDLKLEDHTNGDLEINCDTCFKDNLKLSLGCRQCNIDFCLNCFKPKLTEPITCKKCHVLKLLNFNSEILEFDCDNCKSIIKTEYCFDCRECNYDLCFECYRKELSKTKDCIIF